MVVVTEEEWAVEVWEEDSDQVGVVLGEWEVVMELASVEVVLAVVDIVEVDLVASGVVVALVVAALVVAALVVVAMVEVVLVEWGSVKMPACSPQMKS